METFPKSPLRFFACVLLAVICGVIWESGFFKKSWISFIPLFIVVITAGFGMIRYHTR